MCRVFGEKATESEIAPNPAKYRVWPARRPAADGLRLGHPLGQGARHLITVRQRLERPCQLWKENPHMIEKTAATLQRSAV